MDGNISPLSAIRKKALPVDKTLIVDDAHGFGVLGQNGRGSINHAGLTHEDIALTIFPCGKSMGAMGAIVCADLDTITLLIQTARSYIFSTALAVPIVGALNAALYVLKKADGLRNKLFENIEYFNHYAQYLDLNVYSTDATPIRSIIIGDNEQTQQLQGALKERGFLVSCIRPPTVPQKTARLRISLTALHDKSDIKGLLDALRLCRSK